MERPDRYVVGSEDTKDDSKWFSTNVIQAESVKATTYGTADK